MPMTTKPRKTKTVATKKTAAKKTNGAGRPVLVTTAHRGVFFGYTNNAEGEVVKLKQGRCCVYWSTDVRGFMGLAATGPTSNCRIGPPADIALRNITAVLECTPAAVKAWESAPWSR